MSVKHSSNDDSRELPPERTFLDDVESNVFRVRVQREDGVHVYWIYRMEDTSFDEGYMARDVTEKVREYLDENDLDGLGEVE